ncbi:unnamed protein product [Zymoseptoria tritici ST99CH_3D1]|nr:unnamed protein product [Zymoseptoria tritici ST99CH_3D1]
MPPRIRLSLPRLRPASESSPYVCRQCRHASLARATTPAPSIERSIQAAPALTRYPPTQPPSYKPAEFRKTQLHRQYQSLLRASPLMLVFQHNNLKATEWVGIRRELASALKKVDDELAKSGNEDFIGRATKVQVVQTGIFASALKVVEFWDPNFDEESSNNRSASAHGLSKKAFRTAQNKKLQHGLEPLLSGPLAVLTIPAVSPQHLKAAISILAPSAPDFPAPKRKANPGYHEPAVQNGIQKLMLLGARVEGKVFDLEGVKWVGAIQGGLDGLRGQLVAMLQGAAAGITTTLEAASKSLYLTVEGRRGMLEEEEKGSSGSKSEA